MAEKSTLTFESGCDDAQGRRDTMEDTHVLFDSVAKDVPEIKIEGNDKYAFYGVYDGHGGVEAAQLVQKHLHVNIFNSASLKKGEVEVAIRSGFESTDDLIVKRSIEKGWMNGSTAVIALIHNLTLYLANIGDSESILIKKGTSGQWEAEALTTPHKASDPTEKERIEKLGGHVFFNRVFGALAVSRSFGDSKFKIPKTAQNFVSWEPAMRQVTLVPNEHKFLVLACDGLWDVMSHQEVAEFVIKAKYEQGKNSSEISKMLVREALNKRTEDNVTVIVLYFNWGNDEGSSSTSSPNHTNINNVHNSDSNEIPKTPVLEIESNLNSPKKETNVPNSHPVTDSEKKVELHQSPNPTTTTTSNDNDKKEDKTEPQVVSTTTHGTSTTDQKPQDISKSETTTTTPTTITTETTPTTTTTTTTSPTTTTTNTPTTTTTPSQ